MSQAKAADNVKSYKKIVSEISDCIELNDLNDMEDIELIDDYVCDLTDLLQKLRHRYERMEDSVSHEEWRTQ